MSEEQTSESVQLVIEEKSGCKIIHCPMDVEDDIISQLMLRLTVFIDENCKENIVIDLENQSQIDHKFFRSIATLGTKLKKITKKIHIIHPPDDSIHRSIREQGMDSILKVHPNLSELLKDTTPAPAPAAGKTGAVADVVFLNAFIDATLKTLSVQCSVDAKAGKACLLAKAPAMTYDIVGIIGLASKAFRGTIAVCYPKETFLKVLGSMLGETYTEISKDLEDGAAELLNIIFGQAKIDLNQKGYEIEKAIPSVIRAPDLKLRSVPSGITFAIPFESPAGQFRIEITVDHQ